MRILHKWIWRKREIKASGGHVGSGRLHIYGGYSGCQIPFSWALIICLANVVHNMDPDGLLQSNIPNARGAPGGCGNKVSTAVIYFTLYLHAIVCGCSFAKQNHFPFFYPLQNSHEWSNVGPHWSLSGFESLQLSCIYFFMRVTILRNCDKIKRNWLMNYWGV